jgi:hypothetical protein
LIKKKIEEKEEKYEEKVFLIAFCIEKKKNHKNKSRSSILNIFCLVILRESLSLLIFGV